MTYRAILGVIEDSSAGNNYYGDTSNCVDNGLVLGDPVRYAIPDGGVCGEFDGYGRGGRREDRRLLRHDVGVVRVVDRDSGSPLSYALRTIVHK